MAPEQVRGLDADHGADILACGAVLFEMLAGRRAFRGETPADTMSQVLNDPPSALAFDAGTPPALAHIVQRCLEKKVEERFQSAQDVGIAIESVSNIRSVQPEASTRADWSSVAVLPFTNVSADPEKPVLQRRPRRGSHQRAGAPVRAACGVAHLVVPVPGR